jgi:hypothetical protein
MAVCKWPGSPPGLPLPRRQGLFRVSSASMRAAAGESAEALTSLRFEKVGQSWRLLWEGCGGLFVGKYEISQAREGHARDSISY